jgi:hypothetical protein
MTIAGRTFTVTQDKNDWLIACARCAHDGLRRQALRDIVGEEEMPEQDSEDDVRRSRVRALFREQYPSCDRNGADVYAFSEWLLQNEPDLLPANRGTFYQDLKDALHGLWRDWG